MKNTSFYSFLDKKKSLDSQALFEKKSDAGGRFFFLFHFLFPQKQMREAGFFCFIFYFLKNR